MTNIKILSTCIIMSVIPALAQAQQLLKEYAAPETNLVAPDQLPPVGGKFEPMKSTYYFKRDGVFSKAFPTGAEARIQVPKDFQGSVYVEFKSKLITNAVRESLTAKGVKLATKIDEADLILGGMGYYGVYLVPGLSRQINFDRAFDENKTSASILDARIDGRGVAGSAIHIADAVSPGQLLASFIEATMDLTGATSALDKKFKWAEEARLEKFTTFGDCYDKQTRAATCPVGGGRTTSFLMKSRLQFVDFTVALKERDKPSRLINLVARKVDARTETDSDLPELLAMAIQEMTADFPTTAIPKVAGSKEATDLQNP